MSSNFSPESINLSRQVHQIIQIIEKDRFSLASALLKTRGQKKIHQKWKLFCPKRISKGSRDNLKKLKIFKISNK